MEVEVKMKIKIENENGNGNDIDMHCVIEHHNTQYAPVDTINRDNERSQP
jgi:hypothetical protein